MTLNASSTLAEVKAAYLDNASYAEDRSVSKARAFATACRMLLLKIPKRMNKGGSSGDEFEFDPVVLRDEMRAADRYAAQNASGAGGVVDCSFTHFRD